MILSRQHSGSENDHRTDVEIENDEKDGALNDDKPTLESFMGA